MGDSPARLLQLENKLRQLESALAAYRRVHREELEELERRLSDLRDEFEARARPP